MTEYTYPHQWSYAKPLIHHRFRLPTFDTEDRAANEPIADNIGESLRLNGLKSRPSIDRIGLARFMIDCRLFIRAVMRIDPDHILSTYRNK